MFSHQLYAIVVVIVIIRELMSLWPFLMLGHPKAKAKGTPKASPGTAPTQKPSCPACAAEASEAPREMPPAEPPPLLESARGRPRSVDTSSHYCPEPTCQYYGWLGRGNLRANGHPNGGRWRQLQCVACGKCFMETTNTIFYGKKTAAETIWQALKALAEGLEIRATARVFDLDPNTVEKWLAQAADHMAAVSTYLIHDLELQQVQVDELWALLGRQETAEPGAAKQRRQRWVWAGVDPVSKLMLGYVVGDRSLDCAQLLVHIIATLLAPGCVPLFVSDGWSAYGTALLSHFGHWVEMPRQHKRGAPPKPRWQPLPQLQYAQVVKQRVNGRVVSVSHKVIYGTLATINIALTNSVGRVINTAFIERLNLTLRHHVPALGRKVLCLAKGDVGLERQLTLVQAYYNFCLPHAALRLPLTQPVPTKGHGSPKRWQPRTPAMAAAITNQLCRLEELLLVPVPPWPQAPPLAA